MKKDPIINYLTKEQYEVNKSITIDSFKLRIKKINDKLNLILKSKKENGKL